MEALVAVGLAANTVQFIDFTLKLLKSGKEYYREGVLAENTDLEDLTSRLEYFSDQLNTSLKGKARQSTPRTKQDGVNPQSVK